jgi:hypothetical protein
MNRDLSITPANQWCQEQFEAYDLASESLQILNANPSNSILWTAKQKRAERLLTIADIKANAAEFIRIITKAAPTGEILIDIPSAAIEARIKW